MGYRRNPFGALSAEEWTAVVYVGAGLRPFLQMPPQNLQLLGAKGCGKSSSLLKIADYFRGQGVRVAYEYLPEGQHHFVTDLTAVELFVLDEAQRLSWRERRRWLATAVGHIFSSHQNLAPLLAAKGIAVQTVQVEGVASPEHYEGWIGQRLAYFALPGVAQVRLTQTAVRQLYYQFGADLREAEYFLYELFEREWPAGQIDVADIKQALQ